MILFHIHRYIISSLSLSNWTCKNALILNYVTNGSNSLLHLLFELLLALSYYPHGNLHLRFLFRIPFYFRSMDLVKYRQWSVIGTNHWSPLNKAMEIYLLERRNQNHEMVRAWNRSESQLNIPIPLVPASGQVGGHTFAVFRTLIFSILTFMVMWPNKKYPSPIPRITATNSQPLYIITLNMMA